MRKRIPALTRLLLPVKDYELFKNILPLVELVSSTMDDKLEKVDLLHVVGGSFMSTHLRNIDFRADRVLSSELMQRLREKHYQEFVNPLLSQIQELLQKSGVGLRAKVRIEDGDPVKKITAICEKEEYSTLVLSRRKGEEDSFFMGTVITGIMNRHISASLYLVGEEGPAPGVSPAARVMIGIDGSSTCLRAVHEAAAILGRAVAQIEQVFLVNVIDPSGFYDKSGLDNQQRSITGYKYMQEAEDILVGEGVEKIKIVSTVLFGKPGKILKEHAQTLGATMCYVGRRDRSKIAEVLLGSVSSDFVNRCRERTIVLVS
ncbi:universal stress protein [Desulfopila sp. IMCC35006]|uniref:universal stress protein n=1 Tax=Desulfopila sp. IMCC35006 TaxID=2569542 RepID=UPI0010AB75F2|nr:universal stress protein [Desulfopila sp. IMCC35006]TKB25762.1 universal stress protein [Desulfopila sp. IMCC35006]